MSQRDRILQVDAFLGRIAGGSLSSSGVDHMLSQAPQ
jgi:hypothetical protein